MSFFKHAVGVVVAVCVCLLVGCGGVTSARRGKQSGKKVVVTTFTIMADMVREVAGEAAEVESLIRPGAEIHGYEPSPRDIVKAQSADLIVWNGLNLERWFEKFFEEVGAVPRVLLTEGIEPLGIGGGPGAGQANPHAWMAPALAVVYVENIRRALVGMDPANEAVYGANAAAYTAKLQALDGRMRERLAAIPEEQRWLVTSEGAFSYLCQSYGLRQLYLWPVNAEVQGTPQQVQAVIDGVRAHRIPVVFSESTVSDRPARQVAQEAGARYGGVLYVDSLTSADGPAPTFLKLLEYNADAIVRGLLGE
jgi:manganese/iron transport system substrate-binding protein